MVENIILITSTKTKKKHNKHINYRITERSQQIICQYGLETNKGYKKRRPVPEMLFLNNRIRTVADFPYPDKNRIRIWHNRIWTVTVMKKIPFYIHSAYFIVLEEYV